MKTNVQINMGTQIEKIDYELNEVRSTSGQLIGHTCELKLQIPTGTIFSDFETFGELDEIISKLVDIRKIWGEKDKELWKVKR